MRVKIPLVIVKALVSGNWYNKSKDPSKMSFFFISLSSMLEDEVSLFLTLKISKGKGSTDEMIRTLLKKSTIF